MSGAALQEMIDAFHALGSGQFPAEVAREAAPLLGETLKASAAEGRGPDGTAWAPVKKTGARAMANAAAAIAVKAFGNVIRVTLTGVEVFHHYGKGKSEARRPVIPDAGGSLPKVVADVLERAAERAFRKLVARGA